MSWDKMIMRFPEGLENVKAKYPQKLTALLIKDIEKYSSDIKDLHTLNDVCYLALCLYSLGDNEAALYFADIVSDMDLTQFGKQVKGFTDSAACAHSYKCDALVLCTAICREIGKSKKADDYWSRLLVTYLETDKWGEKREDGMAQKRWKRNLEKGDLFQLKDGKFQNGKSGEGSQHNTFYNCAEVLFHLLWMKQAGGSELYPVEKLTQLIDERKKWLGENLDNAPAKTLIH